MKDRIERPEFLMWRHSPTAPTAPRTLLLSFKSVELFLHRNEIFCIWIAKAMHMHHCVKISTRARGMNYSFWARGPYVVSGVRATGLQALCHQFLLFPPFSIDLHLPFLQHIRSHATSHYFVNTISKTSVDFKIFEQFCKTSHTFLRGLEL